MEIQKISSITLLLDNSLSRSVPDFPRPQCRSPQTTKGKYPESDQEIPHHFSNKALHLQQTDQLMGQIEKSASSLREKITTMQRTLPPFPPGSQERVRLLKSYVGLRKLIEQLTIPPEVPLFRQKKELDLPEISNPDLDQEWKTAVKGLDKTLGAIQQGKVLTERGS